MKKKRRLSQSREDIMTLPDERYRAVMAAAKFMEELSYSSETPRIPLKIRQRARSILRHFPSDYDLDRAAEVAPYVFQKQMEPLYKMVLQKTLEDQIDEDLKL
jgi:hypothetical protein